MFPSAEMRKATVPPVLLSNQLDILACTSLEIIFSSHCLCLFKLRRQVKIIKDLHVNERIAKTDPQCVPT